MLKSIFSDIFSRDTSLDNRLLATTLLVLGFIMIGMGGALSFLIVDRVGITPTKTAATVVEAKQIVPAHTTTTMVPLGTVLVPISSPHPDSYTIQFVIDDRRLTATITKDLFDHLNIGDKVEVHYGLGRLTNSYQVLMIKPIPQ